MPKICYLASKGSSPSYVPTLLQNFSEIPVFQRFGDKFSNMSILNPGKLPSNDGFVNFMMCCVKTCHTRVPLSYKLNTYI